LCFEGESGPAEESGDEGGPSLDAVQLVPHRGGELVCGAGGEVAQAVFITDQAPSAAVRKRHCGVRLTVSDGWWTRPTEYTSVI
jgi:hypothetical protein